MKKTIIAAGVLAATLVGAAHAGVYVGAEGAVNYADMSDTADIKTEGKNDFGLGVVLGYSHNFGNVYAAGEYSFQNKAGEVNMTDGIDRANFEITNARSLNLKLGYQFSPKITGYGKFGRGSADGELSANGLSYVSGSFDTQTVGAGLMYDVTKNVSLTAEYRQLSNVDGSVDLNVKTFGAGAQFRF